MSIEIALSGALGRMGRRIASLAADAGHRVTVPIDLHEAGSTLADITGDKRQLGEIARAYSGGADVMIDFSLPAAFDARLAECVKHRTAFVSGTTGLSEAHFIALRAAGTSIPVLWAANMSLGVNLLLDLVRQAAAALPESYDIEITEMHHRRKVDAPSGTALALLNAVCAGNERVATDVIRNGRSGHTGERTAREIGMHALRGGDVVGDHTVMFATEGERIELTHKASSRDTFANGAIRAAEWIKGKAPGVYTMAQVLGLK